MSLNTENGRKLIIALGALIIGLVILACPTTAADTTAPLVSKVTPTANATDAAISSLVRIDFNELMDAATLTVDSFSLSGGGVAIVGTVSTEAMAATFHPSANLQYQTEYTATMLTTALDISGNALAAAEVWHFTTGVAPDTLSPVVLATAPQHNAINVGINSNISVTFNEAMNSTSINGTSFTVSDGTNPVLGTITYDIPYNRAIFAPSANLAYNTEYTVTVSTAAEDVAGNNMVLAKVWIFNTPVLVGSGPAPVRLGTAGNFVILAKTAITTVPASAITGNIGLSPAAESYITGFSQTKATGYSTSPQVTGSIYAADMTPPTPSNMTTAVSDMEAAYTDAAGRPQGTPANIDQGGGTISGLSFVPGLYTWGSTVQMAGDIYLNGTGSSNDVWIFQISGDLTVASVKAVILSGGAQARNIFWQVAGIVTLGTGSDFQGIILSQTQVQMATGASLTGRALAQTQVTLDQNAVTAPAQ